MIGASFLFPLFPDDTKNRHSPEKRYKKLWARYPRVLAKCFVVTVQDLLCHTLPAILLGGNDSLLAHFLPHSFIISQGQ